MVIVLLALLAQTHPSSAKPPIQAEPHFSGGCYAHIIDDMPATADTNLAAVEYKLEWSVPFADFVLIPGLLEHPQKSSGEKRVWAPALFTIIAVGRETAESKFVYCEPGVLPDDSTTVRVPISFLTGDDKFSYRWQIRSVSPMDDVASKLAQTLQDFGFVTQSSGWPLGYAKAYNTLFNKSALLCDSDCKQPIDKRIIEREAMFMAWIRVTPGGLELGLRPIVIKRNRREGGSFALDEKGVITARQLAERIAQEVISRCGGR